MISDALKSAYKTDVDGNFLIWVVKVMVGIHPNGPYLLQTTGGRISEKKDIEHYIELGADHISLGTVCFNPVKLGRLL